MEGARAQASGGGTRGGEGIGPAAGALLGSLVPDEAKREDAMAEKPVVRVDSGSGIFWVIGWMFTIAFAKLGLGQALLALITWPYQLGVALRG